MVELLSWQWHDWIIQPIAEHSFCGKLMHGSCDVPSVESVYVSQHDFCVSIE